MEPEDADYTKHMALPAGRSCADCTHIRRCVAFGYSAPEAQFCDFYPSRFRPAPTSTDLDHRE